MLTILTNFFALEDISSPTISNVRLSGITDQEAPGVRATPPEETLLEETTLEVTPPEETPLEETIPSFPVVIAA